MCNYAESVGVFYCDPKEFAEKKDRFLNRLPVSLKQFDAVLRDQTFLAGEEPTVPDFHFCEVLIEIVMMEPHCLQGFSRLQVRALPCLTRRSHLSTIIALIGNQAYLARFCALPAIEAYMKTDRFRNTPVNNKVAAWGANATEAAH